MIEKERHIEAANPDWYNLLKDHSRENRRCSTPAEDMLWQRIRARQLGYKFRRQHVLLDYIADFFCQEKMLIIEVDGGYHNVTEQQSLDEERTARLATMGYRVVRFTNEEIIEGLEAIIIKLKEILDE
ncbi:MAG: endonuclease domain-containing protein [Prevotellaceae bacterium]|nr:endonuclease domain-containing protein [Prevotellaceae bacterium]